MNSRLYTSSPVPLSLTLLFLVVAEIPIICCSSFDWYSACINKFHCGSITGVGYPFWGDGRPSGCGHPALYLNCTKTADTIIEIFGLKYLVLGFSENIHTLTITRDDYKYDLCSPKFVNTTIDYNLFDEVPEFQNISLIYCQSPYEGKAGQFNCPSYGFGYMEMGARGPGLCNESVVVPIPSMGIADILNSSKVEQAIKQGFDVKWKVDKLCDECVNSTGVCGYDMVLNQTTCYYSSAAGGIPPSSPAGKKTLEEPVIIGISVGGAAIIVILIGCWIFYVRRQKKMKLILQHKSKEFPPPPSNAIVTPSANLSQSVPSYPYSKLGVKKESNYFGAQVFSYVELEDATNNFNPSRELGDGGFGTVYYGKLRDGRVVAVKRLHENNFKRVQQFKNEVEILTRLKHQNLVKLYGCTSRRSRELLLVYEYIPNGTVADHLHGSRVNTGLLSWPIRLRIAIETADALAYLHQSEIIHRDVKTNNILLDSDFHVKVADFGLSRLFPNDVSHVSTAPQGTPGYVDPEYYQCYQLTHKSDVYSFGVVLIELISSLQAVDTSRHRNDINLANMGVSKIQNHAVSELVDPSLGFENDCTVRRMVTLVAELAFRCLQQARDMRPSMHEVLEVLRGLENENSGAWKAEEVDIGDNDVVLLKNMPSPPSPDSFVTDQWMKGLIRTM